jgi:hypothetical protein
MHICTGLTNWVNVEFWKRGSVTSRSSGTMTRRKDTWFVDPCKHRLV